MLALSADLHDLLLGEASIILLCAATARKGVRVRPVDLHFSTSLACLGVLSFVASLLVDHVLEYCHQGRPPSRDLQFEKERRDRFQIDGHFFHGIEWLYVARLMD